MMAFPTTTPGPTRSINSGSAIPRMKRSQNRCQASRLRVSIFRRRRCRSPPSSASALASASSGVSSPGLSSRSPGRVSSRSSRSMSSKPSLGNLRVIMVKVVAVVRRIRDCCPEGVSDRTALRRRRVVRQTRCWQRWQGQSCRSDRGAVVKAVTTEDSLDVVEPGVVDGQVTAGHGPCLDGSDYGRERAELMVLGTIAHVSTDSKDGLPGAVEPREIPPGPRQVTAPELVEKERVKAPVARVDSLHNNPR